MSHSGCPTKQLPVLETEMDNIGDTNQRRETSKAPILDLPAEARSPFPSTTQARLADDARGTLQMIQEIASHLPSDVDLCKMIRTCRYFANTIRPPGSGVWRARFLKLYDYSPQVPSLELEYEYKFRSVIFANGVSFRKGEGPRESLWLHCITTMLNESYNPRPRWHTKVTASPNILLIENQTQSSDFFYETIYKPAQAACFIPTNRYLAIQLTLTYFVLCLEKSTREAPGDYYLEDVYDRKEVVSRSSIDLQHALHIRNFWRRHLTRPQENSFYHSYEQLGVDKRPTAWTRRLGDLQPLDGLWLGYCSCLHPFEPEVRQTCADGESHLTSVPVLELNLTHTSDLTIWPDLFNSFYPRNGDIDASDRSYFHGEQSEQNDHFPAEYMLRGFTEVYPAQGGIPGWRRISFVIFKSQNNPPPPIFKHDGSPDDDDDGDDPQQQQWQPQNWDTDFQFAYGYQGIVTPGGTVMLGGWLDLLGGLEESASGPFIFWAVPKL